MAKEGEKILKSIPENIKANAQNAYRKYTGNDTTFTYNDIIKEQDMLPMINQIKDFIGNGINRRNKYYTGDGSEAQDISKYDEYATYDMYGTIQTFIQNMNRDYCPCVAKCCDTHCWCDSDSSAKKKCSCESDYTCCYKDCCNTQGCPSNCCDSKCATTDECCLGDGCADCCNSQGYSSCSCNSNCGCDGNDCSGDCHESTYSTCSEGCWPDSICGKDRGGCSCQVELLGCDSHCECDTNKSCSCNFNCCDQNCCMDNCSYSAASCSCDGNGCDNCSCDPNWLCSSECCVSDGCNDGCFDCCNYHCSCDTECCNKYCYCNKDCDCNSNRCNHTDCHWDTCSNDYTA